VASAPFPLAPSRTGYVEFDITGSGERVGETVAREGGDAPRLDSHAWLATKTDKTATCRLTRIDWHTVGRIIKRVADEHLG